MNTFHLLPDGPAWKLTTENGFRIFTGIVDKDKALSRAVNTVSKETGYLKVHRRDGTVEEELTYPRNKEPLPIPA